MRVLILLIMLALFSGTARADYELLTKYSDDIYLSVDRSTIRKQDGYTIAWFLEDYPNPKFKRNGHYTRSMLFLVYFKCSENSSASKTANYYSGVRAGGEFLDQISLSVSELTFIDIAPGTVGDTMRKAACGS